MLLFEFKDKIKTKYGYDEELAETIAMTAESIIDHMGQEYESVILNAIESCRFVIANNGKKDGKIETIYDVLKKEDMLESIEGTTVSDGDLKRANGVYTSVAEIKEEEGKFQIANIKRIIVLPFQFNHNHPASLATIAHETMHLVKSYLGEYTIEGNILKERNGLGYTEYALSSENGKITKTLKRELGVGLEEGLNSYDELKLVRTSYESAHEVYGYTYQRAIGGFFLEQLGIDELIHQAQLTGNIETIKQLFDSHIDIGFEGFLEKMDESVILEYERFASIFDPEKYQITLDKLDTFFKEELVPRCKSLKSGLQPEMSEKYGIRQSA